MADFEATRNDNNAKALSSIKVNDALIARFNAHLKAWHKNAGDKPTSAMLTVGAAFSKNQSVCEAGFVALQLRPQGCSVKQLGIAFDCGPAHNHTRDLVNAGYVKRSALTAPSLERAKYFTLELTKKGEAQLAKVLSGADTQPVAAAPKAKPVKKAKAKKAKAPKPVTVTPDQNVTPDTAPHTELGNGDVTIDRPVSAPELQALADKFNA